MAVPPLLYGCENLTVQKKHNRRLETAEMKFFDLLRDIYYMNTEQTNKLENK
jgi:hypothetical protein